MISGGVFVDTSAWLALKNRSDAEHVLVTRHYLDLSARLLLTSDYVLDETLTRIRFEAGFTLAREARQEIQGLLAAGRLQMLFVGEDLMNETWNLFSRFPRMKGLSFTDASTAALNGVHGFRDVLALDRGLAAFGLSVRPG